MEVCEKPSHLSLRVCVCVVSQLAVKRIGQSEMNYEKILKAIITDLNNLNQ